MDRALNAQEKVYVHCWGGIGRTGIVVGCYLVRHGITGKTALSEIARLREHTRDYPYPSPTQLSQEQIILNWRIGQWIFRRQIFRSALKPRADYTCI